jgi:hypothetical protein
MSALRVVKDGYSPQEFYIAGSEQGPWSDLYALGATLYHLITGEAPVNGQARLAALAEDRPDPYAPLAGRFEGYPPGFLQAIDKALQTLPKQRVQSAQEWLALFRLGVVMPVSVLDGIDAAVHAVVVDSQSEADLQPTTDTAGPEGLDLSASPQTTRKVSQPQPASPSKRGAGPVQIVAGVAAALAVVGVGFMLMGGNDASAPVATPIQPAPADVVATAVAAPAAPAEAAAPEATVTDPAPAVVAAAAVAETAPVVTAAPEPAPEPVAAPVADTATASAAPALAAPAGKLRENQVGFAAWDAVMPFIEDNRIIGGQRVAIVSRIMPTINVAEVGNWLAPGLLLYTVNGVDVQQSGSFTTAVLNAMRVDPDGKARVVVEYAGSSLERQTGLMTVPATRLVSLANGVNVRISTIEGEWKAVVTGVTAPNATQLRQGDVLFRDKTTGLALSGPETLETIMKALVESGTAVTEFSIIRDNRLATAAMQLAVDAGQ